MIDLKRDFIKRLLGDNNPETYIHIAQTFTHSDFTPVDKDYIVGPPSFVGVGSPKAGTTWWYSLILEHPQVVENRLKKKELSYFYHFGISGISEEQKDIYRCAFAHPEKSICGEWSPGYLWYPLAIDYLAETAPETKIILMLRNPVDRFFSHLNEFTLKISRYKNLDSDIKEMIHTHWVYTDSILQSSLSKTIPRLLDNYSRDQILVLQYELCKKDPHKQISRTYRFLGIDDKYEPHRLNRLINKKRRIIPELSEKERKALANYFEDDVEYLQKQFPEIEVTLWDDFNT